MLYFKYTKRIICLLLAVLMLLTAGCAPKEAQRELPLVDGRNTMSAAVVYDSACSDGRWADTLSYLEQSLVLGVSAVGIDISGE